jgi:hypothetical protein
MSPRSNHSLLYRRFLVFPIISGNLLLARSKPREPNYIGFLHSKNTVCLREAGTEFIESCRSRRNPSPIYDWIVFWRFLKNYDAGRAWQSLRILDRAPDKGEVGGSSPPRPTIQIRSGPETWVTLCTGYIGNTFGPQHMTVPTIRGNWFQQTADSDEGNQYSGLIVISIPGWRDQSSERSDAGFCIL